MDTNTGLLVLKHILFVGGTILFSWGMIRIVKGSATPKDIFTSPLFWGLLVILIGFCSGSPQ